MTQEKQPEKHPPLSERVLKLGAGILALAIGVDILSS